MDAFRNSWERCMSDKGPLPEPEDHEWNEDPSCLPIHGITLDLDHVHIHMACASCGCKPTQRGTWAISNPVSIMTGSPHVHPEPWERSGRIIKRPSRVWAPRRWRQCGRNKVLDNEAIMGRRSRMGIQTQRMKSLKPSNLDKILFLGLRKIAKWSIVDPLDGSAPRWANHYI